jgi:LysM repeat protein
LGLVIIASIVTGIIFMIRPNAFGVYLDEKHMGYIFIDPNFKESEMLEDAVVRLEQSQGRQVYVTQAVTFKETRAPRRDRTTYQAMMRQVSEALDFEIIAAVIFFEGEEMAVLASMEIARDLERELKAPFRNENTQHAEIVGDWEIVTRNVPQDASFNSLHETLNLLESLVPHRHRHVVQGGENLGLIAQRFGTSVQAIAQENNRSATAFIHPGETLYIPLTRPLIAVRTYEHVTTMEVIPREDISTDDPNLSRGDTRVTTEGSDGQRQVTRRIEKINDVEQGAPEVIEMLITLDMVPRQIRVGTNDSIERR